MARYGPMPGCEACTGLAGGAQRVTKPHANECRRRMDDARTSSCSVTRMHWCSRGLTQTSSGEVRRSPMRGRPAPAVEVVGSDLTTGARRRNRIPSCRGARIHESGAGRCQHGGTDGFRMRGLTRAEETELDDEMRTSEIGSRSGAPDRELPSSTGPTEHLDGDVPITTPSVHQAAQAADAADGHMSVDKMEMVSRAAAKMAVSAAARGLTSADVRTLAKTATVLSGASVEETLSPNRCTSKATSCGTDPFFMDMTASRDNGQVWDLGTGEDHEKVEHM